NFTFERRPVYVVEMKQLDTNYIYSKRVITVDKETFILLDTLMYDQKDKLYRGMSIQYAFFPWNGNYEYYTDQAWDFQDVHSNVMIGYEWPAENMDRKKFSTKTLMRQVK
ncbi:MAG: outer membrane lipoprotein-sorting protein, partial [Deltaproteobacteria bacterium]|nr:outer membrane lipoprotein-sorting protein [Deltaproteobacteria bacterium]